MKGSVSVLKTLQDVSSEQGNVHTLKLAPVSSQAPMTQCAPSPRSPGTPGKHTLREPAPDAVMAHEKLGGQRRLVSQVGTQISASGDPYCVARQPSRSPHVD